jgi:hypothetical protein
LNAFIGNDLEAALAEMKVQDRPSQTPSKSNEMDAKLSVPEHQSFAIVKVSPFSMVRRKTYN